MKHISEYLAEAFEERAGICEHEAGMTREQAEAMARKEVEELAKAWGVHPRTIEKVLSYETARHVA